MRKEKRNEPIRIKENDDIGGNQVDTQTSSSSGEKESELLRSRSVVLVDGGDSILVVGSSIDSRIFCRNAKNPAREKKVSETRRERRKRRTRRATTEAKERRRTNDDP